MFICSLSERKKFPLKQTEKNRKSISAGAVEEMDDLWLFRSNLAEILNFMQDFKVFFHKFPCFFEVSNCGNYFYFDSVLLRQ